MKKLIILLIGIVILIGCDTSVQDATNKILVVQNEAINAYMVAEEDGAYLLVYMMAGISGSGIGSYKQKLWENTHKAFKMDSLVQDFRMNFSEEDFNKLLIKLDDNFQRKMNNRY